MLLLWAIKLFLLQNNRSRMENTIGIIITTAAGSEHTILLFTHTNYIFSIVSNICLVFFFLS